MRDQAIHAGQAVVGPGRPLAGRIADWIAAPFESHAVAALAPGLIERGSGAPVDRLGVVKPSTRHDLLRRIERARAHLHGTLDRAVPLRELAQVAGLSQFHLARYFSRVFDCPPAAYHRRLRLRRAAEYLIAGAGTVADAAELVGYSDGVALSHAFRKQFGEAPRRWATRAPA